MPLWKFQCLLEFASSRPGGVHAVMRRLEDLSCVEPFGELRVHGSSRGENEYFASFTYVSHGKTAFEAREATVKFAQDLINAWSRDGNAFHGCSVSVAEPVDLRPSPIGRRAYEDEEQ